MRENVQNNFTHSAIARRYKLPIAGTLLLLTIENITTVLIPYLMGNAIDGLTNKSNYELWIFLGVAMGGLVIGVLRRLYDTRVYGRIYRETASETVEKEIRKDSPISKMTARANFVSEFTDFFEHHLPAALMAGVMLLGSVIMLAIISPLLSVATSGVALIVGLIFFFSRKRIHELNAGLNDDMEQQVDILTMRDNMQVKQHFSSIVRWRIRLSDLEARNFGGAFFFAISLLAGAVYVLVAIEGKSAGQAFAGLTYILQFTEAVIIIPFTYQSFLRTKEISVRLDSG